jgi:hypothetical protein
MNRILTITIGCTVVSAASVTFQSIPDSINREINDYLSVDERLAMIRKTLPLMGSDVAEQLRIRGGFATTAEAVTDFLTHNRPELLSASSGDLLLSSATHLRNSAGALERLPNLQWLRQVAAAYLACLERPFCKYMPAYYREPAVFAELFTPGPRYTVTWGVAEVDEFIVSLAPETAQPRARAFQLTRDYQPFFVLGFEEAEGGERLLLVDKHSGESLWLPYGVRHVAFDKTSRYLSVRRGFSIFEATEGSVRRLNSTDAGYKAAVEAVDRRSIHTEQFHLRKEFEDNGTITAYQIDASR